MPAPASITRWTAPRADTPGDLLAACQSHVRTHGAALSRAARGSAGAPGARLVQRFCADIAASDRWQMGFTRRLRGLRDFLRSVQIPDLGGAWASECCRHAELLEALIARGEVVAVRAVHLPRAPLRRPMRTA